MRRREFITLLGGAAAAWPIAVRGEQGERMRRIGVLLPFSEAYPEAPARLGALREGLQQSGWTDGRNMRIDYRWGAGDRGDTDRIRRYAAELVALAPDVILASTTVTVGPLLELTRTIPIVFVNAADPVGAGLVESLARPGGNVTGFALYEYDTGAKLLELLKEIAPRVTRAAIILDAGTIAAAGQFGAILIAAPSVGVQVSRVNVHDAGQIERAITAFASASNDGLIVMGSPLVAVHRDLIVSLAAQHKLPAVYFERHWVAAGGLIAYGTDLNDQYRLAAGYVDRILRGEKPANLPVQAPVKYELVINLKTAKALGLEVPPTLLARADEVIE